jgi:hypothetical protein
MAFPWSKDDLDDSGIPELPAAAGADPPAGLVQLVERLDKLGTELGQANRELAGYLARRESSAQASPAAPAEPPPIGVAEKLESLIARFEQLIAKVPREAPAPAIPAVPDGQAIAAALKPVEDKIVLVGKHAAAQNQAIAQLQELVNRGFKYLADQLAPKEAKPEQPAVAAAPQPAAGGNRPWEEAILGPDLAAVAAIAPARQQLIGGVLSGDPAARALSGQLLLFRSAPVERLAPLLKDVGEAYYRWQPKTKAVSNPVEEALAAWLQRTCEAAGIHNSIELVNPGERFDSLRHNASSRGVEITEVLGWVVLRDNGKVYTKAAVAVR